MGGWDSSATTTNAPLTTPLPAPSPDLCTGVVWTGDKWTNFESIVDYETEIQTGGGARGSRTEIRTTATITSLFSSSSSTVHSIASWTFLAGAAVGWTNFGLSWGLIIKRLQDSWPPFSLPDRRSGICKWHWGPNI